MIKSPYLEQNVAEDNARSPKEIVLDIARITKELNALIARQNSVEPLEWVFIPKDREEEVVFLKMMALFERIEGREEEWIDENTTTEATTQGEPPAD